MIRACILFGKEGKDLVPYTSDNPPAPTFFTGERIRGTVLISHNATKELIFDTAQLLLRGGSARLIKHWFWLMIIVGDVTITVHLKADLYRKTETPVRSHQSFLLRPPK